MIEMKFTPSVCDGEHYEGHVVLRPLSYEERLDLYERTGLTGHGVDENETEEAKHKRYLKAMREVAKMAKDYVVKVDIVRIRDGFHLNSWEHLWYDYDMAVVVNEIATKLVGKFSVGDPS